MKYPFTVFQSQVEDHIFWVAKSTALKGCVGQGDTMEEALSELSENELEWLETAKIVGIPIPAIPIEHEQEYSGKMTLRIAPSVHRQAAAMAKKDGISLNQYINDAIVSRNAELSSVGYISDQITGLANELQRCFFSQNTVSFNSNGLSVQIPFDSFDAMVKYSMSR